MTSKPAADSVSQSLQTRRDLKETSKELAKLNRELVNQMIILASQTGDVNALIQSADMLRRARDRFGPENTPQENAEIHLILASTLYQIAQANRDIEALDHSMTEYRHAITLASVTNNEALRSRVRSDYKKAQQLSRDMKRDISNKGAA